MLSQPVMRVTRIFGFEKGSLASRYMQLYLIVGLSYLLHHFQMFKVTRRNMGEFAFFMSQPVAITFEDLVLWAWSQVRRDRRPRARRFERAVGFVWTFVWFSLTLHVYIRGLLEAEVARDWTLEDDPLVVGTSLTQHVLEGLKT
jgi:hypothetical protein